MTPFRNTNVYNVPKARFVQFSQQPEMLDFLAKTSGLNTRKVYDRVETETSISWKVSVALTENLPAWLHRFFPSDQLRFINECVLEKDTQLTRFRIYDPKIEKYLKIGGLVTLREDTPGRTTMIMEGTVEALVPVVGKKIEEFVAERSVISWNRDAVQRGVFIDNQLAKERSGSPT